MPETRTVDFRELLKRLHLHQVEFVVIGGVAAALHGSPLGTYDLDVCAPLDDANLARILAALRDIRPRHRMRPDKLPVADDPSRLRGIKNLYVVTDLGILDLLGDLPGVGSFQEIVGKTVDMNIGGIACKVLDIETLIAAKTSAGRDKDIVGVRHLQAIQKFNKENPGLFEPPSS